MVICHLLASRVLSIAHTCVGFLYLFFLQLSDVSYFGVIACFLILASVAFVRALPCRCFPPSFCGHLSAHDQPWL